MKENKSKAWSISSMTCGILGLCLCFMPYIALPLSILAIIFRCKNKDSAMSTAGLVTGIIGLVLNAIMMIFFIIGLFFVSTVMSSLA